MPCSRCFNQPLSSHRMMNDDEASLHIQSSSLEGVIRGNQWPIEEARRFLVSELPKGFVRPERFVQEHPVEIIDRALEEAYGALASRVPIRNLAGLIWHIVHREIEAA